jgi:hypothetical protein
VFDKAHFKSLIEFVYAHTHADSYLRKSIVNRMVGMFRRTENAQYKCAVSQNATYANYLKTNAYDNGYDCSIIHDISKTTGGNETFVIKQIKRHPLYTTGLPIHRQIVSENIIRLNELYIEYSMCLMGHRIVRYCTDSVCVDLRKDAAEYRKQSSNNTLTRQIFTGGEKTLADLGKYQFEEVWSSKFKKRIVEPDTSNHMLDNWLSINSVFHKPVPVSTENDATYELIVRNKGAIVSGFPGSGKTHLSLRLARDERFKKVFFLAMTNVCVNNFKEQCTRESVTAKTLDMFLETSRKEGGSVAAKLQSYDLILLDEYSLAKFDAHITPLYKAFVISKAFASVVILGDSNQCHILQGAHQYDYDNCSCIHQLTRRMHIEMQFKESFSRYDVKTYQLLQEFKLTRSLRKGVFAEIDPAALPRINLCFSNFTRKKINKQLLEASGGLHDFTPMIAIDKFTDETLGTVFKNQRFDYAQVKHCASHFEPAHCITSHKIQGSTLREPYAIHDLHVCSFNNLYTMISRCESLDQIRVCNADINPHKIYRMEKARNKTCVPYVFTFTTGYLYEIRRKSDGEVVYVGITEASPIERWRQHIDKGDRNRLLTPIDKFLLTGTNTIHHECVTVGEYNIHSRSELEYLERVLIQDHLLNESDLFNVSKTNKKRQLTVETELPIEPIESATSNDDSVASDTTHAANKIPKTRKVALPACTGRFGQVVNGASLPDSVYRFENKPFHDKNGLACYKIRAWRPSELLPTGKPKTVTKTYYDDKSPSFEEAFEYMKQTYTPFELVGMNW